MTEYYIPDHIEDVETLEMAHTIMRYLVARYGTASARNTRERTALHWAVISRKYWLVSAVLCYPIDVNAQDDNKETAILMAARLGDVEIVILLAGAGADAEIYDNKKDSPLLWAAYNGFLPVIMFLVEELEVDVDHTYIDGRSAVLWAARQGHTSVVRYLYLRSASRHSKSNDGFDLIHELQHGNSLHIIRDLRFAELLPLCHHYKRHRKNRLMEIQTFRMIREYVHADTFLPPIW